MDNVNNAAPRTYLDFQGLGELKGRAARDSKGALRETAQQFEALFLQMMMKSMRESIDKSDLLDSSHADTFEAMFDREVSVAMARRNALGLADMLVDAQSRQMSAPTADALKSRAAGLPLNPPQAPLPLGGRVQPLPLTQPGSPMPLRTGAHLTDRSQP